VSGGSTVAVSVQFCWPPAFKNLAVCVQDLVAADTRHLRDLDGELRDSVVEVCRRMARE
jgi:hypothetical protein